MDVIVQQIGALLVGAVATAAAPAPQPTILQDLAKLLAGAIPTSLLFLVLVVAYEFLVYKPLTATLARRRALTQGAIDESHKAIAQAEAKTAEYAEKLRLARAEAYKVREQRMKQWTSERDAALDGARKSAHERINAAKSSLDAETAAAKKAIEASAADLAAQAVRAVLPVAAGGTR
jgi:F-type H+-transporting ATPase subunit b